MTLLLEHQPKDLIDYQNFQVSSHQVILMIHQIRFFMCVSSGEIFFLDAFNRCMYAYVCVCLAHVQYISQTPIVSLPQPHLSVTKGLFTAHVLYLSGFVTHTHITPSHKGVFGEQVDLVTSLAFSHIHATVSTPVTVHFDTGSFIHSLFSDHLLPNWNQISTHL